MKDLKWMAMEDEDSNGLPGEQRLRFGENLHESSCKSSEKSSNSQTPAIFQSEDRFVATCPAGKLG